MSLEMLLNHFDGLIQTPADVEKLTLGIIDWSIQGRLGTQNINDEPAFLLLEKIVSAKDELEDARKSKRKRQIKPFAKDDIPHPLPPNWEWARLPQISLVNPRNDLNDQLEVSFIPMTLVPQEYGQEVESEIKEWGEIKKGYTHFQENDIGFAKITPCFQNRKSAVLRDLINGAGAGTTELVIFRTDIRFIVPEYVLLFFKSSRFIDTGISKMKGTAGQQRVPKDYYMNLPFPLPPLAEQKRIVARVDELLGQTAVLAQQLAAIEEQRRGVNTAVLHQLTSATTQTSEVLKTSEVSPDTIFTAFDRLYVDTETINDLKQAILQLAIQGRLVPQDPNDEPARMLLERIESEKKQLLETGEMSKITKVAPVVAKKMVIIPKSWHWTRLGFLLKNIQAGKSPQAQKQPSQDHEYGVLKVSAVTWGIFQPHENKALLPGSPINGMPSVRAGDLLISRANTAELVGAVVLVDQDYPHLLLSDKTLRLDFASNLICKPFMILALRANWVRTLFEGQAIGTSSSMRNISQKKIRDAPIALPPLSEQKRIVAKVDELFALCDQLAEQVMEAEGSRTRLLEAILAQAI